MKSLCALALLVLAGCGEKANRPVRIVGYPLLGFFPVYLAQELGHFREEGIAVEFDDLNAGTKMVEALVGGSADVGNDGYLYPVIMAAQGRHLKTFFTIYDAPLSILVAAPSQKDRVRGAGDLKGFKVGVGSFGGLHYRTLAYVLSRSGLALSDVEVIPIGTAASAAAAIQLGKVDAAMINSSLLAVLKQRAPGVRVLIDTRFHEQSKQIFDVDRFPGSGLFATAEWLARNPDKARRLTRAMARTLRWIGDQSPEEVLARIPSKVRGEDAALDLEELRVFRNMLSKDGRMAAGGPEAAQRVVAASLAGAKSIDLAGTWTNEFIEVAK